MTTARCAGQIVAFYLFDIAETIELSAVPALIGAPGQLLELRYYDQRLDRELTAIYARLDQPRRFDQWRGARYAREARRVHSLVIDINELTDRTETL